MRWVLSLALLAASCANPPGRITGQVSIAAAPPGAALSMDSEEDCAKLHASPVIERKNDFVLVYIKTGLEGKSFPPSPTKVVIDQKGCLFTPRLVAAQTGQTIAVKNSDPVSHSIHPMPKNNREWNQQQTPGAPDLERKFTYPEFLIPVKCNIHAWMKAYIAVLPHPYFAVLRDRSTFEFPNLPPGPYTLAAWHELHGEKTINIRLEPGATTPLSLSIP
jgi:plastocyanin